MTGRFSFIIGLVLGTVLLTATVAVAQTTEFAFQGKLPGNFNPASGTYQMEFRLYDSAAAGNQIGSTISIGNVAVAQNVFTVNLDFGAAAFPGADRFLEIAARKSPNDPFVIVSPRQKITSSPYSIKSKSAETATTATTAVSADTANVATRAFNSLQFGGLDVDRFVRYDDNDNVGIGTASTGSKLAVAGTIESKSGGIKFPDATTQTTAGLTSINTNATLSGNGSPGSPLGVASPLMVRDMDHPARQPFYASAVQSGFVVTVPAGKRLIIETMTGSAVINNTTIPAEEMRLSVFWFGSLQRQFLLAPSFARYAFGNSYTYYTHSIRLYLIADEQLYIGLPASQSYLSVSGYWVDSP